MTTTVPPIDNRVTRLMGVKYPIVQAPMGWIARAQLASAVSNAGGMGIIETASGELDAIRLEIKKMRDLTDKPFGVNIALMYVKDPDIVKFVVDEGVRFVTTSAGDPSRYCAELKEAGLTVFHVVPTLKAALKAAPKAKARPKRVEANEPEEEQEDATELLPSLLVLLLILLLPSSRLRPPTRGTSAHFK